MLWGKFPGVRYKTHTPKQEKNEYSVHSNRSKGLKLCQKFRETNVLMECKGLQNNNLFEIPKAYLRNNMCVKDFGKCMLGFNEKNVGELAQPPWNFIKVWDVSNGKKLKLCEEIVKEAEPIQQFLCGKNLYEKLEMEEEVKFFQHRFVVLSESQWAFPCFMVPKLDGTLGINTDY
ncbi:hypothetical protein OTU49_014975, partial [Cherax quadricarinatus]